MIGNAAIALCALLIVSSCGAPAVADQPTGPTTPRGKPDFDPQVCGQDANGKFYIALGRNVLALPPTGTVVIGEIYPGTGFERLPAPDLSQPEGCRGNPKQLQSYAFAYAFGEGLLAKQGVAPERRPGPELLRLIRLLHGKAIASASDAPWPGEILPRAQFLCERAAIHPHLSNGLDGCLIKPVKETRIEDWGGSYIAAPDGYTTPLGKPFAVVCGPNTFSTGISPCDVAYTFSPGLGLAYQFQPYRGPRAISIDEIINFDRSLRHQIEAALVKGYQWPDEFSVQP